VDEKIYSDAEFKRAWTDHFPNGDFMETIFNSSFDWNGIRESFVVATENDAMNGAAMLFGASSRAGTRECG
jgi:L-fucose isomerase